MKYIKYLILLCLLINVGCAGTRAKFSDRKTDWRKRNERVAFEDVEFHLSKYVDEKTLEEKCGYIYDAPYPTVHALTEKEMRAKFGPDAWGKYFPRTNEIYYIKGDWDTLSHEYLHRLNHTLEGNQKFECLDEVSADFLDALLRKEQEIRRLKDYIRRLKQNPNR